MITIHDENFCIHEAHFLHLADFLDSLIKINSHFLFSHLDCMVKQFENELPQNFNQNIKCAKRSILTTISKTYQGWAIISSIAPICTAAITIQFSTSISIGNRLASFTGGEWSCTPSAGGVNGTADMHRAWLIYMIVNTRVRNSFDGTCVPSL